MASKTVLETRISKWNDKIDGFKAKIAKNKAQLQKNLEKLSRQYKTEITVDNYETHLEDDFENRWRIYDCLERIKNNEKEIKYAEREIANIQYKLDAILKTESEFDHDLEAILHEKLADFKEQWTNRMLDYYRQVWTNIRKKYSRVKANYDALCEERRTLSHREYYKWQQLDAQIKECSKVIHHESLKYNNGNDYAQSKYDDIIDYYNSAIKRLVQKCDKFNIDRSNISVSYPEVTAAGMECFITDGSGKRIWARMIWAAEYSDYMVPHVRYIVTEKNVR
mgnify:CR=1 FL=1